MIENNVVFEVSTAVTIKTTSCEMLRCVALVIADVSEERRVSIIKVTRIGELGTTLATTGNRRTLCRNVFFIVSVG
jgi:hypothetical protein